MSWSLPFNGKRSIVGDSYHRLAITIRIDELNSQELQESLKELALANLLHIHVVIPERSSTSSRNNIMSLKNVASDIAYAHRSPESTFPHTARALFVSFQFENDAFELSQDLLSVDFDADLWILDVVREKNASLKNIHEMHRLLEEAGRKTKLGISGCNGPMELDWFCTKIRPGTIKLVHLGDIVLPNLYLHSIELVHTLGLTAMVGLTHSALDALSQSKELSEPSEKYKITPDIYLTKCLLQLGCVVSLAYSYYSPENTERAARVSRLGHPFVHRKEFVSMFRVISLSIAQEDLQVLKSRSEAEEAKSDVFWTPHTTARSADRTLTYTK